MSAFNLSLEYDDNTKEEDDTRNNLSERNSVMTITTISSDRLNDNREAVISTILRTYKALQNILEEGQSILLYYGHTHPESQELSGILQATEYLRNQNVKVLVVGDLRDDRVYKVFSRTTDPSIRYLRKLYDRIVPFDKVPNCLLSGWSIICNISNVNDISRLAKELRKAYEIEKKEKFAVNNLRCGMLFDRTGGKVLGSIISECKDMKAFFSFGGNDDEAHDVIEEGGRSLIEKYSVQFEGRAHQNQNILKTKWETRMETHVFRNNMMPPLANKDPIFPLDYFGAVLSMIPSREYYVVGIVSEEYKGAYVKKLIECWYNVYFGTLDTFYSADGSESH